MNLFPKAQRIVKETLRHLPKEVRIAAANVSVCFELQPHQDIITDDIEPDILGLFVGAPHHLQDGIPTPPPQIFLFLENIRQASRNVGTTYEEEVRKTYLHELGHYLGLDEADLTARGLD